MKGGSSGLLVGAVVFGLGGAAYADAVPPTVTGVMPPPGSTLGAEPASIVVTFSEEVDAGTISTDTMKLVRSGGDGTFDDGNEVAIAPASVSRTAANEATMDLVGVSTPDDVYEVAVMGYFGGKALSFDGAGDILVAPQWLKGSGNKVTAEMWCKVSKYGPLILHRASWNDMFIWWYGASPPRISFSIPLDHIASYEGRTTCWANGITLRARTTAAL